MFQFKPPFWERCYGHQASVSSLHVSQITIQPIISAVILKKYINVMYALVSAHEEVRRVNRCRTFAVLLDRRSRMERQIQICRT